MIEDMKLAGHAAATQQSYLRAVSKLSKHYDNRSPDRLSEEEVRQYLVGIQERAARGTVQTSHYGIRFFYRNTLCVDWVLFKKRSSFPSRSGFHRRCRMPKCKAFSASFATPFTAAVLA
jgi:hypothetical protein